ncbi:MAG: PfkB family carbohydrate kinase, partial [Nocardioidaceae bacterium]
MSGPPAIGAVIVLGEVLVELSSARALVHGQSIQLGFSGDALNSAAASAAAGARTTLVARVPDDELGDALVDHVASLGVDCSALLRMPGQHGMYLTRADPSGQRQFFYARRGSVGSQLSPEDVDDELLRSADVVLASGVACAISETAAAAVRHAAGRARRFVYDPNLRPRLTSREAAGLALDAVAPHAWLVTPSWPDEATTLLGLPVEATTEQCLDALRRKGLRRSVLTCGPDGAVLDEKGSVTAVPAPAA